MRNYPLIFVIYRENNSLSLHKISILLEYFADVVLKRSLLFGKMARLGKTARYFSTLLMFSVINKKVRTKLEFGYGLCSFLHCIVTYNATARRQGQ